MNISSQKVVNDKITVKTSAFIYVWCKIIADVAALGVKMKEANKSP